MRRNLRRRVLAAALAAGAVAFGASARADGQNVRAESGGVAVGGSADHATIIIGIPPEKVDALVKERTKTYEHLTSEQENTIALLKDKLDLNAQQVRSALESLGEANIPPEHQLARLVEIAKAIKASASTQTGGDDPEVAALKAQAQQAIVAGDLAGADAALAEVEAKQNAARDRLALNVAETAGRRGEIALARLR